MIHAMEKPHSESFDMRKMIADYMENGLLDNIIDMFKHDASLYDDIPALIKDERMRVRIGTIALLETLAKEDAANVTSAIRSLVPLLNDSSAVVVGDVAYILGFIGNHETIPFLERQLHNEDPNVRAIVQEAIDDIRSRK